MAEIDNNGNIKGGSIGGVTYRTVRGKTYATAKSGVTREKIRKSPEYENTRRRNAEFAGVSAAVKGFMTSLKGMQKKAARTSGFSIYVRQQIEKMLNCDKTTEKGRRMIEISKHGGMITRRKWGAFNPDMILNAMPMFDMTDDGRVRMRLTELKPRNMNTPTGATHIRICLMAHAVSDYRYDECAKTYRAVNPKAEGMADIEWSEYMSMEEEMPERLTMTADISMKDRDGTAIFVSYGVVMYKEENGQMTQLLGRSAFSTEMCI